MEFVWMLIIGLVIGALAKLVMPGSDPGGVLVTILIGLAGSMIAGLLGRALGWYGPGQRVGFVASIVGAIVLLALYRVVTRHRGGTA
ncbi:MAG: GlsB/YeaQ/YmgE family stress response membrane protein [Kofleriaceae bacterium]